jgi:hypothetical protein
LLGSFSWLRWFALMSVPYYALLFGGALLLRCLVGRFEKGSAHRNQCRGRNRSPLSK